MLLDLSIVIVNYNTKELTLDCIASIYKHTKNINFEVILVDNASEERIPKAKNYKLIESKENLGFTGGNNLGMNEAIGRYILLLNSDTLVHDSVLFEMISWMDGNSKIGIATCALKNKNGSLQATGGYFPTLLSVFSWMLVQDIPFVDSIIKPFHPKVNFYKSYVELDWLTGAFMIIRRDVINKIGYLDKDYFMYVEDTDYCYRAKKANWNIVYNPKWSITHFGGASSVKEYPLISELNNLKLFYKKHYPSWQYPVLRFLLKLGCLWRMVLVSPKIYAKAFRQI